MFLNAVCLRPAVKAVDPLLETPPGGDLWVPAAGLDNRLGSGLRARDF